MIDIMSSRLHDSIKGTAQFSDLVIDVDDWSLVKNRYEGSTPPTEMGKVLFVSERANMGWLDDNLLDASEKVYGIHWEVEAEHPRWQLTSANYLRLDVTDHFDARYRIIAYIQVADENAIAVRTACEGKKLKAVTCGQDGGWMGYDEEIYRFISPPWVNKMGWRVTNCSLLLPGFMHRYARSASSNTRASRKLPLVPHPDDGYAVQFNAAPWDIVRRYWRKPINLDRKIHGSMGKYSGYKSSRAAINVLDFDLTLLRERKTFFADFSFMWTDRKRTNNAKMSEWLLMHARGFRLISDGLSPFAKDHTEFLFTLEWM